MGSQKDTSDIIHDPCLVWGVIEETEMIPIGLNSQKEANKPKALLKTYWKRQK